jgi:hypothetical protein
LGQFFALSLDAAILYCRHLGWLAATPEGQKQARHELSAYADLLDLEPEPEAVPIVMQAKECGFYAQGGMGATPITWQEVKAWADATGNESLWMNDAVKACSEAYVSEYYAGKDPMRPSPIKVDSVDRGRKAVEEQFKRLMKRG